MQRWDYKVLELPADAIGKIEKALNEAGAQGFEAVAAWGIKKGIGRDTSAVIMKRPSAD